MTQYGVGQSVNRREDPRLVRGEGRFVDDTGPAGAACMQIVRAPLAHAEITAIEADDARAVPGVLAVLTAADLAVLGVNNEIPCLAGPGGGRTLTFHPHGHPVLADGRVRYVGEPVACVLAETEAAARDGAELVMVDYADLPTEVDSRTATREGATVLWPDVPDNRCFTWEQGEREAVEQAFAAAAQICEIDLVNNRVVQNAMEPRNAVGHWDAESGRYTLTTGTQMPNAMKSHLAEHLFAIEPDGLRILVGDVGGGFGGKNSIYPEQVLVLAGARLLGRPVTWNSGRGEAFVSDFHGRDNLTRAALAFDDEGRILALRFHTHANMGAYAAPRGTVSPVNGVIVSSSCYRIPHILASVEAVYTNTVPTDPYRGAGRPEVIYMLERLLDRAASQLGIDRVELRRRNLIPTEAFPYATPTGLTYDDADFPLILDAALEQSDWSDFESRRREAAGRGRLRGIGLSNYIERCGGGAGLGETARLELDHEGRARLYIGSMANGQGHETAFTQVVHQVLGLPPEDIDIVQGDTDRIATGTGTGGSWSIPMGSGAIALAGERLIEAARSDAADRLEVAGVDLEFEAGAFRVAGTDIAVGLQELARAARPQATEPSAVYLGEDRFVPENYTFPYGCHVAEVEVDPETGTVELVAYRAVHDFGQALNPALLAGQVHGGVTQGIGQALHEHTFYAADGQLLAGSFMDYRLPKADDLPSFAFDHRTSPTARNPFGIKGCGEAGATGAPPAVLNAVLDALAPLGVRDLDMPATPQAVWNAIREAGS